MSRVCSLIRLRDRIRATFRWKWAVLLVVLGCLSFGFGLSLSQNKARAQAFGGPPQVPGQPPQPPAEREPNLTVNWGAVAYFFFNSDRDAWIFFPGVAPLHLTGEDTQIVHDYTNRWHPDDYLAPEKFGRFYIAPGRYAYFQRNDSGGLKIQMLGCQGTIDLTPSEAADWRAWWSRPHGPAMVAPVPAGGVPVPAPGPAGGFPVPAPVPPGGFPVPAPVPAGGVPVRPPSASEESVLPPPPSAPTPR
jgi:hypothetical protein